MAKIDIDFHDCVVEKVEVFGKDLIIFIRMLLEIFPGKPFGILILEDCRDFENFLKKLNESDKLIFFISLKEAEDKNVFDIEFVDFPNEALKIECKSFIFERIG